MVESCSWEGITLFSCTGWGLESNFTEVTLGVLLDKNWDMSQHCTLAVQKRQHPGTVLLERVLPVGEGR